MEDKEIIRRLQSLRQVKPDEEWVALAKQRILKEDRKSSVFSLNELVFGLRLVFQHKLAFATLVLVLVLLGTLGFSQNSVPGEILFSIKRASERGAGMFAGDELMRNFDIANKRLEELGQIAQKNEVNNLAPAIAEYQNSVSETAEKIRKEIKEDPKATKQIVDEIRSLAQKIEEIEAFGVEMPPNTALNRAMIEMLQAQVEDLGNRSLSEEAIDTLEEVKVDIEEGKIYEALEKILSI